MLSKPWRLKTAGYLLLEWVIAMSCLAGFALLVFSMLQLREPAVASAQLHHEQSLQLLQDQQQAVKIDEQRWLLQMQQGSL